MLSMRTATAAMLPADAPATWCYTLQVYSKDKEERHLGGEGAGGVGLDAAHHAQVVQTQEPAPGEREVHPLTSS